MSAVGVAASSPLAVPVPSLVGERVVIRGLQAKPELNGNYGHAVSFDEKRGRYGVRVEGIGLLALKPECVHAAPLPAAARRDPAGSSPSSPQVKHTSQLVHNPQLVRELGDDTSPAAPAVNDEGGATEAAESARILGEIGVRHEQALQMHQEGRSDDSAVALTELLSLSRRVFGSAHPETLALMNNLSAMLQSLGRLAEAAPLTLEVVERRRAMLGARDPSTLNALTNLGTLYLSQGDAKKAIGVRREVVDARVASHGASDALTLAATCGLAAALIAFAEQASDFCEGEHLVALEEAVSLTVAELSVHMRKHGKGAACAANVPPETAQVAGRVFNIVFKQPELGIWIKGYTELVASIQGALITKR